MRSRRAPQTVKPTRAEKFRQSGARHHNAGVSPDTALERAGFELHAFVDVDCTFHRVSGGDQRMRSSWSSASDVLSASVFCSHSAAFLALIPPINVTTSRLNCPS